MNDFLQVLCVREPEGIDPALSGRSHSHLFSAAPASD